jgi:hypothetical protein
MREEQRVKSEVIVRLMMRHGLSFEEADATWEQYRLHTGALRIGQECGRIGIEDNE